MIQPTHLDLDALQAAANEFNTFINEPLGRDENYHVRDYRHTAYQKWVKIGQGIEALIDRLRKAEAVREGWKLVPIEPTTEMKIAGDNAGFWCAEKYRAMLAAAPDSTPTDSAENDKP